MVRWVLCASIFRNVSNNLVLKGELLGRCKLYPIRSELSCLLGLARLLVGRGGVWYLGAGKWREVRIAQRSEQIGETFGVGGFVGVVVNFGFGGFDLGV